MTMATRLNEIDRAWGFEDVAEARGLLDELGLAIMRRLRWAALRLFDMRTEFDVLTPAEAYIQPEPGPMANLGLTIARRVRRTVSKRLDLWTEFATLD